MKQYRYILGIAIAAISALPAIAADSLYGEITLIPGFEHRTNNGFTGGTVSFTEKFNRDREGNLCVGYGDITPDYILVVSEDLPQLTLEVDSGGNDTTLVIQDRDRNILYCGDDFNNNPDARLSYDNFPAGTYQVWIGSFDPNQRWNYNFIAREE